MMGLTIENLLTRKESNDMITQSTSVQHRLILMRQLFSQNA